MIQAQQRCFILVLTGASLFESIATAEDVSAPPTPTYQVLAPAPVGVQRLQSEPITLRQRAVPVLSTVFSRDGKSVVTVDGKGQVVRWDLATPGQQQVLVELNRELVCASLSGDEQLVAAADQGGSVSIFELTGQRYRLQSGAQTAHTVALAFSDDDGHLAGVTAGGDVRLWDSRRGELIRTLRVRPGPVQSVTFSHDGKQLAVGSFASEVRLFDLASQSEPKLVDIGPSRVTAAAFSPDDRRLVVASSDGALRVHDLKGESSPVALPTHVFAVWRIAWDTTGRRLAAASWDGTVRIWETASWEYLQTHKSHEQSLSAMTFGPQGDFVSASLDGRLEYWKCAVPSQRATAMIAGRADPVWVAAYSPDGQVLFVGGRGRRFELWDVATHQLLVSRKGHPTTRCAVFSPDSQTLVTGGDDGIVSLWQARTGELRTELRRHPGAVSAVVYTSNSDTIVSVCDGGVVKLWDTKAGAEKASWREHQEQIYCATISPDDKWLLTGGGNWTSDARGELFVWDLATGRIRARLDGHRLAVWTIAFTPDGRRFATTCSSGEVKLWDWETLTELRTIQHPTWTRALAFSPDGRRLVVGLGDSTVRLWDTSDWQQAASLEGHESFVFHLQFAPDGRALATSGNDGRVRFWTMEP